MKSVVTMMKTAVLLLALALVAAGSGWAQSEEQPSLGDAARKQREKRAQEEQKGKKVLTNEDLPAGAVSSGSQSSSGAASSSEGQAGAESQDAAKPGEAQKAAAPGEDSGMSKAEELDKAKAELESLKHDEGSFERGIVRLEEKVANETDENRKALYANAVARAKTNLENTKRQRAEKEKEVAEKEAAAKAAQPPQEQPPQ